MLLPYQLYPLRPTAQHIELVEILQTPATLLVYVGLRYWKRVSTVHRVTASESWTALAET
jgi:hypothetical protein